jgi:hypothetical protein
VKALVLVAALTASCVGYPTRRGDACAPGGCWVGDELLGQGEDAVAACLGPPDYIEEAAGLRRWVYLRGAAPWLQVRWDGGAVEGLVRWCGP